MNKQSKNICIHVCDDNPVAIEEAIKITKDLLNEEGLAAEIITYKDGNQFTERYKERKDELIILDIEMPGKSGLDILKEFEIHCKNNRVILLTVYDNLALQSLMYGPFQIVRKDLMEIDLEKAIRRFLRIRNDQNAQLEIKEDGMQRVVDIKDIFYIEKRRNYSYIYLEDHCCVKVRKNLRDYEFELAGKGLVRVHAGYMVAMKHCAKIEKGQIVMEDGTEIPISRDRKNMVKEQFMISRRK